MAALTIDELAARVGMTVRNVRAHQSRGLLPPPQMRGRTGYYGEEHVARLELVTDMQTDGFNLRAIRHALDQVHPGSETEVLAFRRALLRGWSDEAPQVVDRDGLVALMGPAGPEIVAECVRLGTLRPLEGGRYEVPSPSLLLAGWQMVSLGVPPWALMEVQRALSARAADVAQVYVELFLDHLWRPFVEAGRPEERWPAVLEAFEQTQPLASQALLATFRIEMQRAVARAVGAELDRADGRSSSTG